MTPTLGDRFPGQFRQEQINRSIKPGSVFSIFSDQTNPPKIKRVVILGMDNDSVCLGFLYINTEININVFRTEELKRLHKPISHVDNGFLDHDSYLDCTQIYEFEVEQLRQVCLADSDCHLGEFRDQEMEEIKALVRSARTISKKDKRKFNLLPV